MKSSPEKRQSYLNNTSFLLDPSFLNDGSKDRSNEGENSVDSFLKETEEINDIIITNNKGEVFYLYSRYNTLDTDFLNKFTHDFNTIYNYFYSNTFTNEKNKKGDNLNEFLYQNGIQIMKRKFNFTRICLPFCFARDLKNEEELAVIKLVNLIGNKNYLIFVTYFPDYSSALIVNYLKSFFHLYNKNFKFDDDYNRFE